MSGDKDISLVMEEAEKFSEAWPAAGGRSAAWAEPATVSTHDSTNAVTVFSLEAADTPRSEPAANIFESALDIGDIRRLFLVR